ncbi:DNA/RNA non-specific endonuclease (plasmid) [Rhizobium leguminosarum]
MTNAFRSFGPLPNVRRISTTVWDLAKYDDRHGYDASFIEDGNPLPLPGLGRWLGDAAELTKGLKPGADATELKYTHFSVKVSQSRRLPLYSAVNIDGSHSDRETERTDVWRFDPRIDQKYQIMREVYGNDRDGFFSRGHMTRREDPNWGEDATTKAADADTFHVTNAAPQRQSFNAGIWLDLENYALSNTDRENMRVTVITGPIFSDDDPEYFGVKVPIAFWKILAFVNGNTNQLTAIGYRRSQATSLPTKTRSRFVFGDFDDTQVPIAGLAEETGLDLSAFVALDVMKGADKRMVITLKNVSEAYLQA